MVSVWRRFSWKTIFVATVLWSVCTVSAQQAPSATFVITISLPKSSIHAGDELAISVITSNPTDHVVKAGDGPNGGLDLEALSEKGKDIGPYVTGSVSRKWDSLSNFGPITQVIKPSHKRSLVWPLKPNPKDLIPGTYILRVHNRDTATGAEVYSNALTLTVQP